MAGLSGLIGAGAADSLQNLLARQEMARLQALKEQQMQIENARRDRQMDLDERQQTFRETEATRAADVQDRTRRDRSNQFGLEQMGRDREVMLEDQQQQALEAAASDPSTPPSLRRIIGLRKIGINATPSADMLLTPEEQDAAFQRELQQETARAGARARGAGPRGEPQWVVGADGQQAYRVPQPGDKRHDPVSERQSGREGPTAYSAERAARTIQSVDSLLGKVGRTTTGIGSLLSMIPESDARNFAAELDTLKANIAFNELSQMREASKTGGALGAVSERELALLESSLGALDTGQSPDQIRGQLQRIKESILRYQQAQGGQMLQPSHGGGRGGDPLGIRGGKP